MAGSRRTSFAVDRRLQPAAGWRHPRSDRSEVIFSAEFPYALGVTDHPAEDGSDARWTSLAGFLNTMFRRFGARTDDAEDLVQESLARVLARPGGGDEPVSFGFAATVGRNLWRDRLRRAFRRPASGPTGLEEIPDRAAGPAASARASEDSMRLREALDRLDPRHRRAIVLVVLEGKSYADAAVVLGVPRGTVKSRIHYGIQRLRAELAAADGAAARPRGAR
jgi:RNA polymerase sigma-70 factor (ECF subfamily)